MTKQNLFIVVSLALLLFLQGCIGVRNSYESLLDKDADEPLIVLEVGDRREVLAVGNGLPGRWGYYPAIASHDPKVASVTCEEGRSFIPFREPGIVFGGERCYIQAHETGTTWVLPGNKYSLRSILEDDVFTQVPGETGPLSVRPEDSITVKVVGASER